MGIGCLSFICNIGNISRIGIGYCVFHYLGSAIRQSYSVFSTSRITIPRFVSTKMGVHIFIVYTIFIAVVSWDIFVDGLCLVKRLSWGVNWWGWDMYGMINYLRRWSWMINCPRRWSRVVMNYWAGPI